MNSFSKQILAVLLCFVLLWALTSKKAYKKTLDAKTTICLQEFKEKVKTGDLIGTRASNNWLSLLHSVGLKTPIAHVAIAVVHKGDVYMFESGAPRGAQLRNVEDYMNEGAECLWWREVYASENKIKKIMFEIERASRYAYSWDFLKRLPMDITGFDAPGFYQEEEDFPSSCGQLIAKVYKNSGIFFRNDRLWMPKHFFQDMKPFLSENCGFKEPLNVAFVKKTKINFKEKLKKLAKTLKLSS